MENNTIDLAINSLTNKDYERRIFINNLKKVTRWDRHFVDEHYDTECLMSLINATDEQRAEALFLTKESMKRNK